MHPFFKTLPVISEKGKNTIIKKEKVLYSGKELEKLNKEYKSLCLLKKSEITEITKKRFWELRSILKII